MNEKDLNIEYICKKTLLNKGDELVPIILDLIQESYKAGLCQAEFDNTMVLIEENQELKEKLLVTQTNEETFRLEMEDITKILGLDEDAIFDDVKAYARSLKDNMFEKKQLNSLVNSCQEEIRQLKKLNEEKTKIGVANHKYASQCEDKVIIMETQQKEFIKYINDIIEDLETEDVDDEEMKGYLIQRINTFKEILQKYKSIIGVEDEKEN